MTELAEAGIHFWRTGEATVPLEDLARWARAQRLLLLLPWRAQRCGWALPEGLLHFVRQEGYATAAWQARALQVLRELGALSQTLGAPALVVKGPVVAEAYPNPLLRAYGDLDLLVREPEARDWFDALVQRGYRPNPDGGRATHIPALLPSGPGPRIELHTSLDLRGLFTWSRWESQAEPWPTAPGLSTPSAVEHWLYLIHHAVEHHAFQMGLGSLLDLAFLALDWTAEQWEAAMQAAEELGMRRTVGLALAMVNWLWDESSPPLPPAGLMSGVPTPPAALLAACQQQVIEAGGGSPPLNLLRDLPERSLRGYLTLFRAIMTGDADRLGPVPWYLRLRHYLLRPIHLLRLAAGFLRRLLQRNRSAGQARPFHRSLMTWLREW